MPSVTSLCRYCCASPRRCLGTLRRRPHFSLFFLSACLPFGKAHFFFFDVVVLLVDSHTTLVVAPPPKSSPWSTTSSRGLLMCLPYFLFFYYFSCPPSLVGITVPRLRSKHREWTIAHGGHTIWRCTSSLSSYLTASNVAKGR